MSGSVLFDVPGPRALVRNRVISAVTVILIALVVWAVIARLAGKGQLTAAKWHPFLTANLWKTYVLPGIQGTLTAAALSIVLAGILGLLLGVGRLSHVGAIRWPSAVIVEFFRAVPVLIMMIFAYFLYALYDVFPSQQLPLAGVVTAMRRLASRRSRGRKWCRLPGHSRSPGVEPDRCRDRCLPGCRNRDRRPQSEC